MLLAVALLARSGLGSAVGLGEIRHHSFLGEPLDATIELIAPGELTADTIKVQLLHSREAEPLGVQLVENFHRFRLTPTLQNGRLRIQVSTSRPVNEPYLNFLVRLAWPEGTVLREYTLLLDPPSAPEAPVADASPRQEAETLPSVTSSGRKVNSQLTRQAEQGDRYQVVAGDTLSAIAARLAAASRHSAADILRWLLNNNPRAFINSNPDRLMAGSWLRLPGPAAPLVTDDHAVAAAPSSIGNGQAREGVAADTAENKVEDPPLADKPVLEIATAETPGEDNTEAENLSAQLMATRETIDMLLRENRELRMRLDRIEQAGLETSLKQLLALKDEQIADLQRQVQATSGGQAAREANRSSGSLSAIAPAQAEDLEGESLDYSRTIAIVCVIVALAILAVMWRRYGRRAGLGASGEGDTGSIGALRGISRQLIARQPLAPRWRPDDEVKQDIANKVRDYEPTAGDENELLQVSPIEESVSEALAFASAGSLDLAEAILVSAQIQAGDDPRITDAMDYVEQLREQSE